MSPSLPPAKPTRMDHGAKFAVPSSQRSLTPNTPEILRLLFEGEHRIHEARYTAAFHPGTHNASSSTPVKHALPTPACSSKPALLTSSLKHSKPTPRRRRHDRRPEQPFHVPRRTCRHQQLERVLSFIEAGKTAAQLLVGGARKGEKGAFVNPAIFLNPGKHSSIYKEDILGSVLSVLPFETEDEAIELAHHTSYGLSAGVYTKNWVRALRVVSKIKAGTISVNVACLPDTSLPYSGFKQSGERKEPGKEGLRAYLRPKSIGVHLGS